MQLNIKHITKDLLKPIEWSGGTSTELAIHPENASYQDRQFNWRLSTATVEVEESNFTSLPGVQRLIMSLSGDLELKHKDHHHIHLKPFQVDCFCGEWITQSFGKVIDFNLMTQSNYKGVLKAISITKDHHAFITLSPKCTTALYPVESGMTCIIDNESFLLSKGELLVIDNLDKEGIKIVLENHLNYLTHVVVSIISSAN